MTTPKYFSPAEPQNEAVGSHLRILLYLKGEREKENEIRAAGGGRVSPPSRRHTLHGAAHGRHRVPTRAERKRAGRTVSPPTRLSLHHVPLDGTALSLRPTALPLLPLPVPCTGSHTSSSSRHSLQPLPTPHQAPCLDPPSPSLALVHGSTCPAL